MARFISVLLVIVLVIAGFGYYRGWFVFGTSHEGDKTNINISVDKEKIRDDEKKAEDKVRNLGHKASDEVNKLKKEKVGSEAPKD
jgi:hypothetical protein